MRTVRFGVDIFFLFYFVLRSDPRYTSPLSICGPSNGRDSRPTCTWLRSPACKEGNLGFSAFQLESTALSLLLVLKTYTYLIRHLDLLQRNGVCDPSCSTNFGWPGHATRPSRPGQVLRDSIIELEGEFSFMT